MVFQVTKVSTHSRPKAAGSFRVGGDASFLCFNTQPPEGGWASKPCKSQSDLVSTHSRPKAAGTAQARLRGVFVVSTHSRPKAAGHLQRQIKAVKKVSTHSRPKAAGIQAVQRPLRHVRFNTQPPEGGWETENFVMFGRFVSTHSRPKAAGLSSSHTDKTKKVSTHSRPKAAGTKHQNKNRYKWFQHTAARRRLVIIWKRSGRKPSFNTQPPEGGWNHR